MMAALKKICPFVLIILIVFLKKYINCSWRIVIECWRYSQRDLKVIALRWWKWVVSRSTVCTHGCSDMEAYEHTEYLHLRLKSSKEMAAASYFHLIHKEPVWFQGQHRAQGHRVSKPELLDLIQCSFFISASSEEGFRFLERLDMEKGRVLWPHRAWRTLGPCSQAGTCIFICISLDDLLHLTLLQMLWLVSSTSWSNTESLRSCAF